MYKTAVLTVSDRCSSGKRQDETGKVVMDIIKLFPAEVASYDVVPDDIGAIKDKLLYYCNDLKVNLVLTNGGTGFSFRDVTPEATNEIVEKQVPGIPELMRMEGGKVTKNAYLSRAVAGIKHQTLIVNLPGSPNGASKSLNSIKDLLAHAVDMIKGKDHS